MSTKGTPRNTYEESADGFKISPRMSRTSYRHGNEHETEELIKSAVGSEKPRGTRLRVSY